MSAYPGTQIMRRVEASLARLHDGHVPQERIADLVGLVGNTNISRRINRVLDGELDGFVEAYTFKQGLALVFGDEELRATVHGLTAPHVANGDVRQDIPALLGKAGRLVAEAAAAISPDGDGGEDITAAEREHLDQTLCALEQMIQRVRARIAR